MTGVPLTDSATSRGQWRSSGRARLAGLLEGFQIGYLVGLAALVGAYYASAHIGYAFQFAGPVAAIVWLPAGVGIAFLYLAGLRFWPGVLVGDLLVNNYSALPIGSALGQSIGNVLEILVAVMVLRRLSPRDSPLATVPGVAAVLTAIAVGCMVSATIGVLSLWFGGVIGSSAPRVWRTWLLGDFSGALIVVPFALAWCRRSSAAWLRGQLLEGSLLLIAVAALSLVGLDTGPLSYLVFPALIWSALRFGPRGATVAITIVSGLTIWGTTHYHGAFMFHSITRSELSTQLYIAVAAISTLTVAAVVCERRALSGRLRASRARLIGAADTERRRLERNLHDGAQQRLVALAAHLSLGAIEARGEPSHAAALFESAEAELQLAIDELRTLAQGILPPVLSRFGLARAIQSIADTSSIPVEVINAPAVRLDDGIESTAYFITAEAIANAHKHARASLVGVRYEMKPESLGVDVLDDGIGGAVERPGRGLEGLRDRVEGLGGSIQIDSPAGRGTRISAAIPMTSRPRAG
jgi:signal transduction histidine kinase